jgi:hypothetical protein
MGKILLFGSLTLLVTNYLVVAFSFRTKKEAKHFIQTIINNHHNLHNNRAWQVLHHKAPMDKPL